MMSSQVFLSEYLLVVPIMKLLKIRNYYFLHFSQHNQEEETEAEDFSKFKFFKMALFDLPLSIFDIFSDFAVGYALFSDSSSKNYGIFSLCLNWVPGLVLFLHIFSKGPSMNYVILNWNFLTANLFISSCIVF